MQPSFVTFIYLSATLTPSPGPGSYRNREGMIGMMDPSCAVHCPLNPLHHPSPSAKAQTTPHHRDHG